MKLLNSPCLIVLLICLLIKKSFSLNGTTIGRKNSTRAPLEKTSFDTATTLNSNSSLTNQNQNNSTSQIQGLSQAISQFLTYSVSKTLNTHYDAREISYYLESHPAHSIHDPRAYFTEERTTTSLAILLNELKILPKKLRFAYVVRTFNELGRKLASKLNFYASELAAVLRKAPDELGNKPDVSMIVDAVHNAFESKEDNDIKEFDGEVLGDDTITKLLANDNEKVAMFNSSIDELGKRLANVMVYFTLEASNSSLGISDNRMDAMATILSESFQLGCWTLVKELSNQDKFRISNEIVMFADRIIQVTLTIFNKHIKDRDNNVGEYVSKQFELPDLKSFKNLNSLSDKTGLIGAWNNYLFSNLGSSERVIKLFASLLARVPSPFKSRWINMYISQINSELERTISGFVSMQGMPFSRNSSEFSMLDEDRSAQPAKNDPMLMIKWRQGYGDDKNRVPARCYLAGRRWRLILMRSLHGFSKRDELLKIVIDKISQLKLSLANRSGNEMYRLCLPRVEVGLKGYSIDGEPETEGGATNRFFLKNPIDGLDQLKDPFTSGVYLGYKLGIKIGFNEERNATLEMESDGSDKSVVGKQKEKGVDLVDHVSKVSYRKATSVAAKTAFEIAIHEGYLTAIRVSMKAGMHIITKTAAEMASLKSTNYGKLVGKDTGRSVAEEHLQEKKINENERKNLIEIGEAQGEEAGKAIGETIGLIVGAKVAEEAYRNNIIRGGKLALLKFHLEEFEAGAKLGFEFGCKEGKRIGSSASLDPSAPNFLRFSKPKFDLGEDENDDDQEVDEWENELIPPIKEEKLIELQAKRDHTLVSGSLKGIYKVAKEVKKGLQRVSYSNITYNLEVFANGFIMNNVAYLTLNGTINKLGLLRGSLIYKDIFNDNDDDDDEDDVDNNKGSGS